MKLLDLFCGAGGCAEGYRRAGFDDITGIDVEPQKRYPFRFIRGDALEYLKNHAGGFDMVHASPPCQSFSAFKHMNTPQPDLIEETREALGSTGKPYVIENVRHAPLETGVMLCGTMFNLRIKRHRYFQCNPEILFPPLDCNHSGIIMNPFNVVGRLKMYAIYGRGKDVEFHWKNHIGVSWMGVRSEWREAIPPAYTEYIGKQMINAMQSQPASTEGTE